MMILLPCDVGHDVFLGHVGGPEPGVDLGEDLRRLLSARIAADVVAAVHRLPPRNLSGLFLRQNGQLGADVGVGELPAAADGRCAHDRLLRHADGPVDVRVGAGKNGSHW